MAYATQADMVTAFGEAELISVTTPEGAEQVAIDPNQVTMALNVASDEMDTYLRRRYAVPVAVTSPVLTRYCCVLARWVLWAKVATSPSDAMRADRKDAIAWLTAVNNGSVTLDGAVPLNVGTDFSQVVTRPPAFRGGGL